MRKRVALYLRVCVHTEGLAKGYNAFVTARVKEVASQIGAPKADSDNCKTNLSIIFNTEPQKLLDVIGAGCAAASPASSPRW